MSTLSVGLRLLGKQKRPKVDATGKTVWYPDPKTGLYTCDYETVYLWKGEVGVQTVDDEDPPKVFVFTEAELKDYVLRHK